MRIPVICILLLLLSSGCRNRFTFEANTNGKLISPASLQLFVPSAKSGLPQNCSLKLKSKQDSTFVDEYGLKLNDKKWVRSFIQQDVIDYIYLGKLPAEKEHLLLLRYAGGTLFQALIIRVKLDKNKLKLISYKKAENIRDNKIMLLDNLQIEIGTKVYNIETYFQTCN